MSEHGLLASVNSPADLRRLDHEQLAELARQARDFIVRATAINSGHLGSNLGVVELTFALHRVFDSPNDVILWDTGHQAYVHKLVTGRRDQFARLRQPGGLSGYPSRAESPHDFIENSHASTVLSYAHGLAEAFRAQGCADRRRIVAVIGDGSMTGGMAYEALNNLGHTDARVLVVLNDNGRSYAPTVGRLSSTVSRIRLKPSYVRGKRISEGIIEGLPLVGDLGRRTVMGVKAAIREVVDEPHAFFEQLGVRYVGPLDGHDTRGLEEALRDASTYEGAMVLHVLTQKGRGYSFAEDDDEKHLHDVVPFDPRTGPVKGAGPRTYTHAFTDAILDAAARRPDLHAITAAMPGPTGLLAFQEKFPEQFHDVGIAEQHAVTLAAGMAMGGLRPVVAIYSTFLTRAFDQVNLDVGLHGLPVVFALDRSGITGDDGPSHHGVLDLALLTKVPGMTVLAPSSAQELVVMLSDALDITSGPVTIRYPKGAAREVPPSQVGSGLRARLISAPIGAEVCILAVGKLVEAAEHAAALLTEEKLIPTAVWDVRVCTPLDPAMIEAAAGHRLVVTVEDGVREGGVGSLIVSALGDAGAEARTLVLGTPLAFLAQGKVAQIHTDLGLDAVGIAQSVERAWRRANGVTVSVD